MSGILFSTAERAAVVAKLVILGILSLISFILPLRAALVAKLQMLILIPIAWIFSPVHLI